MADREDRVPSVTLDLDDMRLRYDAYHAYCSIYGVVQNVVCANCNGCMAINEKVKGCYGDF